MSQVETQQPRRQDSAVNGDGQQKPRGPKKGGNRPFSGEGEKPRSRGNNDKGDRRDGGSRRGPRRDGDRPIVKDSRTIFVGKVFTDDLEGSSISEKLKDQRIKYLRDTLEQFGAVESFDAPVGESFVLATFATHKAADDALKAFRNRDEIDNMLERLQGKLTQSKLPMAVCPELHRYKYSWSTDKQSSKGARTAGAVKSQLPKNVVAKKTSDQQVPSPTAQPTPAPQPAQQQQQQAPKTKKPRKGKNDQEDQTEAPQQPQQQQAKPKKTQQQNVQQQAQTNSVSPKTQQGADDLQREAERARLTQDLTYLRQQQQHVTQELNAESDRSRARDERINRLSDELGRVRQHEDFLESQLKAEQQWKQTAEERIVKLKEEVNHFVQEQKQVEKRLSVVSQQLNGNGI